MNVRQKFLISFGVLFALLTLSGILMLRQVDKLGRAVDVILRENYQSVIICQNVNESLERIDSGLLFAFSGEQQSEDFFTGEIAKIKREWQAERNNITVATEGERAAAVSRLLDSYLALLPRVRDGRLTATERLNLYNMEAFPLFLKLKKEIGSVLEINQNNMTEANNLARAEANRLFRQGIGLLTGVLVFLLIFTIALTNWIQKPLRKLIMMTNEIANGNLALALDSKSNDEIGQLSRSFNAMAIALRNAKEQLVGRLHRSERMNKDVFNELPTPIVVFDIRSERIELATESARKYFGMTEGRKLEEFKSVWLDEIFKRVRQNGVISIATANDGVIQEFIDGQELFFQPTAVPLPAGAPLEQLTGVVVILKDVTMAHEQQELKRSVISTVSHQLKTPLTSLQMSIYLLLEEKCGALNPDQLDLVMTMRDDSQRLTDIIGDLLDLNKTAKPGNLVTEPHAPSELLMCAKERFQPECREREITLETECDPASPVVDVAFDRVNYAFDNLIGNAIRFTNPGGKIRLTAKNSGDFVEFSVFDTGCGMTQEVAKHIFEPFYRGPGQDAASGVGLGLAIVKEIIAAHGGKIDVQSQVNSGTVFTFTLPVGERNKSC